MPDIKRWNATWQGLGVDVAGDQLYREVVAGYSEPHRRYHTMQHLGECFTRLDEARDLAERVYEVELALWFHDVVYDVRKGDNEEQSASWARDAGARSGLPSAVSERICQLILATKHDASPATGDAALLVDVDLAILGAATQRFDEYEQQVRQEYDWVPNFLFRRKRREILQAFLARPRIYSTEHFRQHLEAPARANLARSIQRLGG
jgi:predicted metal-dependent HD superfamily phosphohydrolase